MVGSVGRPSLWRALHKQLNRLCSLAAPFMIAAFLWNLHRDVASLRKMMAELEGRVDVLTGAVINSALQASQGR